MWEGEGENTSRDWESYLPAQVKQQSDSNGHLPLLLDLQAVTKSTCDPSQYFQ
jgi:hypothetical protein